jgi:hypothetical protein
MVCVLPQEQRGVRAPYLRRSPALNGDIKPGDAIKAVGQGGELWFEKV